jgi:hypothetical protein
MAMIHHKAIRRDNGAGGVRCVECEPIHDCVIHNHFNDASANCFERAACRVIRSLVGDDGDRFRECTVIPQQVDVVGGATICTRVPLYCIVGESMHLHVDRLAEGGEGLRQGGMVWLDVCVLNVDFRW